VKERTQGICHGNICLFEENPIISFITRMLDKIIMKITTQILEKRSANFYYFGKTVMNEKYIHKNIMS
jgi:hypothetical protein